MRRASPAGLAELHLSVLLFGGTAVFSRLIPLDALDITVYRCVIATLALALLLSLKRSPIRLQHARDYGMALILGIIVSLHWVTYFAAMQMSSVAIGMIAFFTYPVMTVLIEPLVSDTRLTVRDMICGLTVLIGVWLLIPAGDMGSDVTLGIFIGILSAALFTARNLLHKRYFAQYSGPQATFYQTAVAVLFLCAFVDTPPADVSNHSWQLLLLLGICFTAMPHALFSSALRHLSAKTLGLVSCLQPLYGTVLALWLLNETPSLNTLIGGLLVVSTALFETAHSHRAYRQKNT
ncbi:MAG: DMT family transporter, partial [Plesiomonas shigelloides]